MEKPIQELLENLETERGIEILFACESGSRAWGFASPDSDYDIRFLYREPLTESYLVTSGSDSIEIPIKDDLDPAGWDLRKSLRLLAKSNGALIEWLHSPVIYRANEEFLGEMRCLAAENFSRRALANHYGGMARQVWKGALSKEGPSGKSYLYALRSFLCARHVTQVGTVPPVIFRELLPLVSGGVGAAIEELLGWKESATEAESPGRIAVLDDFLREGIEELGDEIAGLPAERHSAEPFNEALHRWTRWPVFPVRSLVQKVGFTLERVRQNDLLLFEGVSGSRSFGTEHAGSDTDLRGVFVAPLSFLVGLETIEQVSDEKSDEVYYEIGRFISLLTANNPNIVELLYTPEFCVRYRHPAFDLIKPEMFVSKLCQQSFGNYAMGQIRKARGLNKKIVNPEPEVRRHLREFCHVPQGQGSVGLAAWLSARNLSEEECALVSVRHSPGTYAIFTEEKGRGIFTKKDDSALLCSSVSKEAEPIGWMTCNFDAFKAHCRAHRDYWKWVEARNEDRYLTNTSHGRGYDSKNLMHTLRLLDQGLEIAQEGLITLPRPNATWLKEVKSGSYDYEDLLKIADEKHAEMEAAFEKSNLPDRPSRELAEEILLEVRSKFL
ncbi:MAG: putative nucleotidyltransferase [Akkermansiaceae bacterium]